MKTQKEESSLKQLLDKYHPQISLIEEKKPIHSAITPSTKILNSLSLQGQGLSQIPNSNEPRHKNLERMLKKLNTEQEIDYLNKTTYNDSFYSASNQHMQHLLGTKDSRENVNHSLQQTSHHDNVLTYFKRSKKASNASEQLFQEPTDTIILKQSFTSILNGKPTQSKFNPLSSSPIDNKPDSLYIKTSVETSNIVQSIDSRIKELKLKFLRDTHIDLIKLSQYDNTMLTLISFLEERDIKELYHSCTKANQIIRSVVNSNCQQYVVDPFIELYGKCFLFQRCLIVVHSNEGKGFMISAVIQCKTSLPKDYSNCTIEFSNKMSSMSHKCEAQYRNCFRFDYIYTQKPSTYWLMKEETFFNYDDLSKAYCMPLMPVYFNDSFTLSVNLISKVGIINFQQVKWEPITYSKDKVALENFVTFDNNTRKRIRDVQLGDYDLSRFCELELIKTKWMDYFQAKNLPELIHSSINKHFDYLKELFSIDRIEYDDVGFLIVKVYTVASCIGTLPMRSDTLGMELCARAKSKPIVNEIRKNGLIYDLSNKIEFRQGDKVIFYFSFNKFSEEELKQRITSFN